MRRKGNKFTQNSLIKNNKNHDKINVERYESGRYWEKCSCGSGLLFSKCCYRSDHRIFNLARYIDKLKNFKLKMHDLVLVRFLDEYKNIPEIGDIVDKLSDDLKISRFNQILNDISSGQVKTETSNEKLASAIRFETLAVDRTLPGHDNPIFQEFLKFYVHKASDRFKKCYNSYSKSQFSFYEVIKVKKAEGAICNTWFLIRDLFTKKELVIKDPLICSRLCIWDIIIGRLYRVAGFNLFSTAVFILNPNQQKILNRILFMFWLKDAVSKDPNVLRELKSKHPQLNTDFSHKYASFSRDYFYNHLVRKYLKLNSPILMEIMNLTNQVAPQYPVIIKSPDKQDIFYAKSRGELSSEKVIEAVEVIRSDIEYFREVPKMDENTKFSFDYFIDRVESTISEEIIDKTITPENLIKLSKESIIHKIHELFQKTIVFGATPIMLDWTMEQKVEAMENINVGPKVRVGFVEIKRDRIKLVTYSKKSMKKLLKHIKTILKSFLVHLSPPIYTDLLEKSREQCQFSEHSTYLSSKEKIQSDEAILPHIDNLTNRPEIDFRDEEEDILQLESRVMRYYLMKRWTNQKISLLGGKSPKESLTDAKHIHLLIDLIKEIENVDDRRGEFDSNRTYSTYLGIDVVHYQKNN